MPEVSPSKYTVHAGWDDVPHISEDEKAKQLAATPPHLRQARSQGIPSMGAGAIYPIDPAEFTVPPFQIPEFYYRGYGLDVGWNKTAAVWGALDRDVDILYLTSEHYRGQAEPEVHARAIKARGDWMTGHIDPAAAGAGQIDGRRLIDMYRGVGLNLVPADNAVEAGLLEVYQRLTTGRMKVFSNLANWLAEYRFYSRDENGKIVKKDDHLMDATRYLAMAVPKLRQKPRARPIAIDTGSPAEGYFN